MGIGDFNGDGEIDILWRYYGTGDYQGLNVIWYMNGEGIVDESVFSQITDTELEDRRDGRLQRGRADGHPVAVLRDGGLPGLNGIWYMNGRSIS